VVGDRQVRCLFLLAGNLVKIRILFGLPLLMLLIEIQSSSEWSSRMKLGNQRLFLMMIMLEKLQKTEVYN